MSFLIVTYLVSVLALLATAVGIWRMHCENFGCMGLGVAWFAWAIAYAIAVGLGWFVRSRALPGSGWARACKAGWWVQLAAGVFLVGIWLIRQ